MGFRFAFGKKEKMRKLISDYFDFKVREKRTFDEHLKHLKAQLSDKKLIRILMTGLQRSLRLNIYRNNKTAGLI